MSKQRYLIIVHSQMFAENEEDLQEYLADQDARWASDRPEEVQRLKDTGVATFNTEAGATSVRILRVAKDFSTKPMKDGVES